MFGKSPRTDREDILENYLGPLFQSATGWHEAKLFFEHLTAICHDTLHLAVGTALWLLLCGFLRRPITAWTPLLSTLVIALLNEAIDLWVELWPSPGMQLGECVRDVAVTMIIPLLFFVAARGAPAIFPDGAASRTN